MKSKSLHWIFLLMLILSGFTSCSEDDDFVPETEQEPTLNVTPTTMTFTAAGSTKEIQITSNRTWSITGAPDWITLSANMGEGTTNIQVTANANGALGSRTATLTVTTDNDDLTDEVQISQEAAEEGEEPGEADGEAIPPDNSGMRDLTSVQLTDEMGIGWNLGNSLEAIGGETAWGNPAVTEELIQAVKEAGFDAVRIPVAWSKFSDAENFEIREEWMIRVEEVVNYVLDNDMYAIINIHWDNGWMQPTHEEEEYVNNRLDIMWHQIAIHFRDYDDRLLFAGTNEVMVEGDYGTPTEEYYTVQNGFNQTFVNTVRETGGRNHYRHLVVQGFNTNIDHTVNFAVLPEDVVDERLMMEVHYYDPFNFTLNEQSNVYQWGEDAPESENWANESHVDNQFQRMKTNFIDEGIGVILGEYGAISREGVEDHEAYREYYIEYVTQSAVAHGLVPFYWDNGHAGNHGFAIFDRTTGEVLYPNILNSLMAAAQ